MRLQEVLEDWSQEKDKKKNLLVGRRVELAEELSKYISSFHFYLFKYQVFLLCDASEEA